ncbi:MAG: hypothetical protein ACXWCZ_09640 [Flavisolibacter sp.]
MKTASAYSRQNNYTVAVDLKSMHHNWKFHIEIPSLNLKGILVKPGKRFKWVAVTMLIQSIFITPIISIIIFSTGNWPPLWFAATASMYATFIPSLSGQELKWIKTVCLYQLPRKLSDYYCCPN